MATGDQTLKIIEAQAVRYRVQSHDRRGEPLPVSNVVILLDGETSSGDVFRGVGEAQIRNEETGEKALSNWELFAEEIQELSQAEISLESSASALTSVANFLDRLIGKPTQVDAVPESEASSEMSLGEDALPRLMGSIKRLLKPLASFSPQSAGRSRNRARKVVNSHNGLRFGLETALLDLASRGLGITMAELISNDALRTTPVPVLQMERVTATDFDEIVARISEHERDTDSPLWLDFGQRFETETTEVQLGLFADLVASGQMPEIVMYRPLQRRFKNSYAGLAHLTQISNAKDPEFRGVTIARDVRPKTDVDADPALGTPSHAAVIRPASLGGIISARDLITSLEDRGMTAIYLADSYDGGAAGFKALFQLAASLPVVRGIVTPNNFSPEDTVTRPVHDLSWLLTAEAVRYASTVPYQDNSGYEFNEYPELPYLQELGPNGTKGHLMEREALARGLDTVRYSKGAFTATDGEHAPLVFKWSRSPLSSAVSLSICTHKEATRMRLGQAGIPVPRGRTFRNGDYETARQFADAIGFPVVVKPAMGVRGIGVVAGIQNQKELELAFTQLRDSKLGSQDFIVEKHVHGKDYRIVVVGDEVIAAILREPASVEGDGVHTITELVLKKNALRRRNPHLWGRPIVYDAAAEYQLARRGVTPDTILEPGQTVMLSASSSLSQGGESFDVLDELHPSIKDASVRAVKAIPGLAFCGVDFLMEDHRLPLSEQEAGICELNAHAAIGNCEYPLYGQPRQVARTFMDLCVAERGLIVWPERADHLSVQILVRGRVVNVGYRAWLKRLADSYGIVGWVENTGPRAVTAALSGETKAVTALVASAVLGPQKAKPTSVTTTHVEPPTTDTFTIVRQSSIKGKVRG